MKRLDVSFTNKNEDHIEIMHQDGICSENILRCGKFWIITKIANYTY